MFGKQKVAALVAEFLGTGVLTLVFLTVWHSQVPVAYFVALAVGLGLALITFVLHETSAAHFNPALTLALWTARKVDALTGVAYIVVQVLGAWAAYYLFNYFYPSGQQSLEAHYVARTMVAEAVGTLVLAFGVAATVYKSYSTTAVAAYSGLAYMLGIVVASTASIGLLNPAVAVGFRTWHVFGSAGWGTYALGPVLGAVVGVNLYAYLFSGSSAKKVAVAASTAAPARKPAAKKKPAAKRSTARRKR